MPQLHEILASIHRLDQLVARGQARLIERPDDWDVASLVDTNAKLLKRRRREFEDAVKSRQGDVVTYSVYSGKNDFCMLPNLRSICSAFTSFETAVLLTAQAKLLDVPQRMRRLEQPVAAAALRYGYLSSNGPQHLAFVAATRGETQLELQLDIATGERLAPGRLERLSRVPDRVLKEAAHDIFALANSRDSKKLAEFSRKNGSAILVEVNDWCQHHTDAVLDAEAVWGVDDPQSLRVTAHQMETLRYTLEKLSDDTKYEMFEVTGSFYAFNIRTRRFAFEADDGMAIAGHVPKDMFNSNKPAKIPRRYKVVFQKKIRFNEALGQTVTTFSVVEFKEAR